MIISKQKTWGRCHVPGDSVQGLVRVRNLIMPTCSPNLPASEIGLGSISEEMETLFILIRLLEQRHLNWKAIWEQAQMVTLMFFSSNLWFCRNNSIPITRTKVCFIDFYFLNFRKCLINLYVCLFLFLSSPHLKFKYRTTLLKAPGVAAWQFLQTLNSQNHKLH